MKKINVSDVEIVKNIRTTNGYTGEFECHCCQNDFVHCLAVIPKKHLNKSKIILCKTCLQRMIDAIDKEMLKN